jgi:hypothetical protein
MGCGELSKIKKSQSVPLLIKPRISKELRRGETISTGQESKRGSVLETERQNDVQDKLCLKFRIFDEFKDLIAHEASYQEVSSSLVAYRNDMKYLKQKWIMFKSALSYFDLITHGCCIDDFHLTDGLVVVLVSSLASNKALEIDVITHSEAPYIVYLTAANCHKDTLELIRAWQSLATVLCHFSNKRILKISKILSRFEDLMVSYKKYIPAANEVKTLKKSAKNLKSLIDCIKNLMSQINNAHASLKTFILSFKTRKPELETLGKAAMQTYCYSGEQIVHYILGK